LFGEIVIKEEEHNDLLARITQKLSILEEKLRRNVWVCSFKYPTMVDILVTIFTADLQYGPINTQLHAAIPNLTAHYNRVLDIHEVKKYIGSPKTNKVEDPEIE